MGIDILGIDILGIDIVAPTQKGMEKYPGKWHFKHLTTG